MKKMTREFRKRLTSRLLALLGFGTTFVFMACYGPAPDDYRMMDDVDEILTDSTTRSVDDSVATEPRLSTRPPSAEDPFDIPLPK